MKTRMVGLSDGEKNFEDMCNRSGTTPPCDGLTDRQTDRQTDGRTDILLRHSPRYAYASLGKKKRAAARVQRRFSRLILAVCYTKTDFIVSSVSWNRRNSQM